MYRVRIRRQTRPGERWLTLAETRAELSVPVDLSLGEAAEIDLVAVRVVAPIGDAVRLLVGSVVVASSVPGERVLPFDPDDSEDEPALACRGRLFADGVGQTELRIEIRPGGAEGWLRLVRLPLEVAASKIAAEQFNQLFAELQRDAAAVLLDVHGKTRIGMKAAPLSSSAPVAVLARVHTTVRELSGLLHQIARQPACRMRTQLTREQTLEGQSISEATLAECCRDPDMLGRRGKRLVVREHLREHSRPDYRLIEHQTIADFGAYLVAQLADLRQRIDAEISSREGRRCWRNVSREPGGPTWWQTEDQPRIEELGRCRQDVARLRAEVEGWNALPFLLPGRPLRHQPPSTPLFRNHPLYSRVYRAMASHFRTYQATLDTHGLLTRARSLPVLYEWWCASRILRILATGLLPRGHDPATQPVLSTLLAQDGQRFTIEFGADRSIDFMDEAGTRVRFRYHPVYTSGRRVAVLDAGGTRTPDVALEITLAGSDAPELIIVLDAKYSSADQRQKMSEVALKYAKIGDPRTGRVLSRQVWALTPTGRPGRSGADLRSHCTVDNVGFWSERYDIANPVNGAVQTRPVGTEPFDPLRELLVSLLTRAGVKYQQ